jgi:LysM repeat protein
MTKLVLLILFFSLAYGIKKEKKIILQEITVKEGETLWSIANYYLKNPRAWPEILKYNPKLSRDPNVVLPGMKLLVPIVLIKEHLRVAAYVVHILNKSDYMRKGGVRWKPAYVNLDLYNEDALRTYINSVATVKFLSGEVVRMEENSLVIVRPELKREEVELKEGGIRAGNTKIVTASAVIDPKVKDSDFRAKLAPDKTTIVEVYKGLVDVTAQGKTVRLKGGFGTRVRPLEPPELPKRLPKVPKATKEVASREVYLSDMNVSLKIPVAKFVKLERIEGVRSKVVGELERKYHLQISPDVKFKKLVVDEIGVLKENINFDFKKYNLKDGRYYYRFSYIDGLGFESDFSQPLSFCIDTTPPKVELVGPKPEEKVSDEMVHVIGKTEKNAKLLVNGRKVPVKKNGEFHIALSLSMGENKIEVKAEDPAGNVTSLTRVVYKVKERIPKKERYTGEYEIKPLTLTLGLVTSIVIGFVLYVILS